MGFGSNINAGKSRPFEIVGVEETIRQFQHMYNLGARTHNFKAVFTRAAKPMKAAARSNALKAFKDTAKQKRKQQIRFTKKGAYAKAKRQSGPIWKAISIITSKRFKGVFWLGPTRGRTARYDAWYAYFQEKGTVRGIEGKFFMKRAYDQWKWRTRQLISDEFNKEIYKLIAKRIR